MKAFLWLMISSVLLMGCGYLTENDTKVALSGGAVPAFSVSGDGTLGDLVIYGHGQRQRDSGSDRDFAFWEIQPVKGYLEGEPLSKLGTITYGVVPEGYKQIYPEGGKPAPPLSPAVRYEYWFQTVSCKHARAYFEIRDGSATVVSN